MSTPRVYKLFLDKAAFNHRFAKYIKRHFMTTLDHNWTDITEFLKNNSKVIAKPLTDFGGHGVFLLNNCGSGIYPPPQLNNVEQLHNLYDNQCSYILEETICNCDKLSILAPASLNTLRFVTVINKEKKLHIIAALLRMGNGTAITDNYHDGGMACAIDLETGRLKGKAYGMNCVSYDVHPYSKIKFDGYEIPQFEDCVNLIKEIAFVEPEARYVGWDLAITPNGIELLEGNIPPGEDITQIATGCGMWYQMLSWK
jgi:hypothetical protein